MDMMNFIPFCSDTDNTVTIGWSNHSLDVKAHKYVGKYQSGIKIDLGKFTRDPLKYLEQIEKKLTLGILQEVRADYIREKKI